MLDTIVAAVDWLVYYAPYMLLAFSASLLFAILVGMLIHEGTHAGVFPDGQPERMTDEERDAVLANLRRQGWHADFVRDSPERRQTLERAASVPAVVIKGRFRQPDPAQCLVSAPDYDEHWKDVS